MPSCQSELAGIQRQAGAHQNNLSPGSPQSRFLTELKEYAQALDASVSKLHEICAQFASRADSGQGPTWSDYQANLQQYERSRQKYVALGDRLNVALRSLSRDA